MSTALETMQQVRAILAKDALPIREACVRLGIIVEGNIANTRYTASGLVSTAENAFYVLLDNYAQHRETLRPFVERAMAPILSYCQQQGIAPDYSRQQFRADLEEDRMKDTSERIIKSIASRYNEAISTEKTQGASRA